MRQEVKIVLLGAQGAGKTSFVNRYVGQIFTEHTSPTIGASFYQCSVRVNEHDLRMAIWDTAGQERFRSMAPMYYRNANAAILMYDITCNGSFESMKEWIRELKLRLYEPVVMCIVGNKCDLNDVRQVSFREASEFAMSIGALYHEASALNSEGVKDVFMDIALEIISQQAANGGATDDVGPYSDGEIIRMRADEEKSFICC